MTRHGCIVFLSSSNPFSLSSLSLSIIILVLWFCLLPNSSGVCNKMNYHMLIFLDLWIYVGGKLNFSSLSEYTGCLFCSLHISYNHNLEIRSALWMKFSGQFGKELCFLKSIVSFNRSKYFSKYSYDLIFPKKHIFTNVEILVFLYLKGFDDFERTKHDMNTSKPILDWGRIRLFNKSSKVSF